MSVQYDNYLLYHKANVTQGYYWIRDNLPELIEKAKDCDVEHQICFAHDASKSNPKEYYAYDAYFYGGNRTYSVVLEFNKAWLHHIHTNPHHWQHWILIHDDPEMDMTILEMPYNYILEMICDWWAFSWKRGKLDEIFKWYDEHKAYMKLHDNTRKTVEHILAKIKEKLEETSNDV